MIVQHTEVPNSILVNMTFHNQGVMSRILKSGLPFIGLVKQIEKEYVGWATLSKHSVEEIPWFGGGLKLRAKFYMINCFIRREFRGRGIATELLFQLIEENFNQLAGANVAGADFCGKVIEWYDLKLVNHNYFYFSQQEPLYAKNDVPENFV